MEDGGNAGSLDLKAAFVLLQPLCSRLASAASGESTAAQVESALNDLARVVPSLPPFGLYRCLDYLLMPLLGLLRGGGSEEGSKKPAPSSIQVEAALQVMAAALERCGAVMEMQGEITFASPRFIQLFHTLVEVLSPSPPTSSATSSSSSSSSATAGAVVRHAATKAGRPHEDLKLCTVRCMCALLRTHMWPPAASTPAGQPPFIASKSSLALSAYGISLLMDEATTAVNRDLRVASLEALSFLCSRLGSYKSGEAVAFVLPGLVSALGKIILGDFKQGHRVVEAAVDLCAEVVSVVMSDENNRPLVSTQDKASAQQPAEASAQPSIDQVTSLLNSLAQKTKTDTTSEAKDKVKETVREAPQATAEPFTLTRDHEWLQKTISNLRGLFADVFNVSKTMLHQHWRVRKSIARCASRLLLHCRITLDSCANFFMSALAFLAKDDFEEVSAVAMDAIKVVNQTQGGRFYVYLSDNMHEGLLAALPRHMRDADESTKLAAIRLLFNHMYLLGDKLSPLLASSSFLGRFSIALLQILEFDPYDVQAHSGSGFQRQLVYLEQPSHRLLGGPTDSADEEVTNLYPKRTFRYFRSEAVEHVMRNVCLYLGRYGDLHSLLDHFFQVIHHPRNKPFRSQAFYIINNLLLGAARIGTPRSDEASNEEGDDDITQEVELVLEEYLDESLWSLPSTNAPSSTTLQSVSELNENAISMSLLLEGIGDCAQVMRRNFDQRLMAVLHPLLEKLGDANGLVSRSAYATLQRICYYCEYTSLPQLIARNADYLIDSISMRMRHLGLYPNTPQVLRAILEYGILKAETPTTERRTESPAGVTEGADSSHIDDIVWLLDDTIQSVFNGLDEHNVEYTLTFCRILEAIVGVLARKYKREGWSTKQVAADTNPLLALLRNEKPEVGAAQPQEEPPITTQEDNSKRGEEKSDAEKMADIEKYFNDYREKKQKEQEHNHDEEDEDEEEEDNGADDHAEDGDDPLRAKSRQKEMDTVVKILERCQHFVSSRRREVRLSILEIVTRSMEVLSADRKRLLPAVHLIWGPLTTKFAERDRVQAITSWEVVTDGIARHAGDFVFHRVRDDLWPALRDRVIPTDYAALRQEMRSLGSFSPINSLVLRSQQALLHALSELCFHVFARMPHFGSSASAQELAVDIFGVVYVYLDDTLPAALRDEAIELIKRLALLSPRMRAQLYRMADQVSGFYATDVLPYPFPPPSDSAGDETTTSVPSEPPASSSASTISMRGVRRVKVEEIITPRVKPLDIKRGLASITTWLHQRGLSPSPPTA